ncbi:MAG: hypothetical protein M1839_003593 [Geoglossum umbratile]|nr:MAG: hypothetical protein M1839_003593 [Geoglossum umbratile]
MTLHDRGFHYSVAVVARYSCSTSTLSRKLVFSALREVVQQHPALGVVVASGKNNNGGKPCFLRLEEIDLNKIVSFVEKPAVSSEEEEQKFLDGVLSEQNSRGFDTSGSLPLWRVVVLQQRGGGLPSVADLAFVWHHVIADGLSGLVFHSAVLQALSSASQTIKEEDDELGIVPTSTKPLLPPLEDILSLSESTMAKISGMFKSWLGSWFAAKDEARKWTGAPYQCKSLPTKTLIRQVSIPAASVNSLVSRCHSERTSITALLQTLVGKVLAETFEDSQRVRCATAISVRRFFPAHLNISDDNSMGLWVTASRQNFSRHTLGAGGRGVAGEFPWGEAKKNKQRIQKELAKGDRDITMGSLRHIPDFDAYLTGRIGKKREDSYSITNIGVFDGEAPARKPTATADGGLYHQWRISRVALSQSCHVNGSAVQFCIASTKGGEMVIALNWQEGVVPVSDIDRVVQSLREQLLRLGDEGGRKRGWLPRLWGV